MGCCMTTPNAQSGQAVTVSQAAVPTQVQRRESQNGRDSGAARDASAAARGGGRGGQPSSQGRQGRGQRQGHGQNSTGLRITYLQNTHEIIKHDKTVGSGVQKTLAYDTPFSKTELATWRSEFWETRTSGSKQVWMLLKNACEADHEDAQALIQAAALQLPQESLTTAIDSGGVYYRVPICCIQLPDNYNVDPAADALRAKKAPKEKQVTIKVRNPTLGDKNVVISNSSSIEQVKEAYILVADQEKVAEKGANAGKLRFFCLGKELKNELFIYSYEMNDNIVVQAMLKQ